MIGRLLGAAVAAPGSVFHTISAALEPRRAHDFSGRCVIAVRGAHLPGSGDMAQALSRALLGVTGVTRAEVNGRSGHVLVAHDGTVSTTELVGLTEEVERDHGRDGAAFAPASHPARGHEVLREGVLAGVDLAGAGVALVGRLTHSVSLPPGVASALALAEATPRLRDRLSRHLGRAPTDLAFGLGTAVTNALALQPLSLVLDSAHRMTRIVELRAHGRTWERRIIDLDSGPGAFLADPLPPADRPVPLPDGPVERAAWSAPAGLAAAAGAYALTRDVGRTQGILAAGVPRAARLGRAAFAVQLGRVAAERGVLCCDRGPLVRLDRVDRVLVDSSALRTGRMLIDEVIPLSEQVEPEELYKRAHSLVDLAAPKTPGTDGGWTVAPLARSARGELRERSAEPRRRGASVLALARDGEPVALVSVVPELDPLADALIAAARTAGPVTITGANRRELARRLAADGSAPGGNRLAESVRELQREGRVVALVSAHNGAALAAADLGVGLLGRADRPPWGAHLLCGPGLAAACFVLGALGPAREASGRSARIAAAGSAAGGLVALISPSRRAARRVQLTVDSAAAASLALGTWAGLALARRPAPVAADRTPWHAWPVAAVLNRLGSSAAGLPAEEAERRHADGGPHEAGPPGLAQVTAEELNNPLTPALAAGAGISALVGSVTDATLIGAVLAVNAVMSGLQRVGADRALQQLVDLNAIPVRLQRPGQEEPATTGADRLVPGDVISLVAGDAVPADARLLSAESLEVDESSLTGESQLVTKDPAPSMARDVADRHSMLYEGTVVAAGEAVAVVVATGSDTEFGRAAGAAAAAAERRPGGVETRLRRLTEVTLPISLGAGGVLFASSLLRGQPLPRALGSAVSLAVAAVPEGLPFVATAAELATARRLYRRGALVRNPGTIEALGRVDVLCFDKTGTLTEGRLRLRQISDGVTSYPVRDLPPGPREILATALRATPADEGHLPHPTDRAVLRVTRRLELPPEHGLDGWTRVDEMPFEPARGFHAVLGRTDAGRQLLSVKGAPEILLDRCETWCREGELLPFNHAARHRVDREVERLALLGYRVLAVAERNASGRQDLTESRVDRLCFRGLLCIADPVRPTAARAVARLRLAGVDIAMITGDHPSTAEAIAAELDVPNGKVMVGSDLDELDGLDDAELAERIAGVSVFARMSPTHKARIVRALRAAGRVVAVTGDGANDAPAIRLADVGIALGERATPAARETSDVVVVDDRIETITDAIADCRAMWRSTRDALAVLLGGNLGEIGFTVGTGVVAGSSPLNVRQLLLVNLLTDMLPAIALAVRAPSDVTREELLAEGPDRSLGAALTRDIAVRAGATAGAAQVAWLAGRLSGTRGQAATTGLVALVATQLIQTVAAGGRDPVVLAAGLFSLAALGVIVQVPGISHFFGNRPLLPHCWAVALGSATAFAVAAVLFTRLRPGVTMGR
ncbi:hypothetical protein DPM19_31025 [Actinomadura craniellae]|uniref:Cation-transporting P-type ATPase N-terminal domain-containing protein n=1 Tax=Actinomadura craniellae TaxID=2231787 RepID=A0A365GWK7_9ACTN|nr:cation-translocating P-type ATPase [Actinomadura craniellae]RAY11194.1 hypothetical protein DPM19_31025 [Actinomadura craniellae]